MARAFLGNGDGNSLRFETVRGKAEKEEDFKRKMRGPMRLGTDHCSSEDLFYPEDVRAKANSRGTFLREKEFTGCLVEVR